MYQVTQHIDNNKIFIVQRSEIEGRLDAQYYNTRVQIPNAIRLSSFAQVKGGKRIPKGYSYANEQTPYYYLRVADMDNDSELSFDALKFIGQEVFSKLERYEIKEGELAISIAGTIGKVCYLSNVPCGQRVILTENCAKIVVKNKQELNVKYLEVLFKMPFIQKQLEINYIQTTIPKLGIDKIVSLKFPQIPSIDFQQQVINYYNSAYTQKLQKEAEAQQLLDSIDTYLLNELGIKLPTEPNDLSRRKFYISYSELVGKRIDSKKYSPAVKQLYAAIRNSSYHNFPLQHYVAYSCSGEWGVDGDVDIIPDGYVKCLTLRAAEIDNQYNLKIQPENAKYRLINADKYNKIKLDLNDLIIEKSGGSDDQPVGRVAIIEENTYNTLPISFSNFLMKIRVQGINPKYLYYFLKTMYNIGITDSMQSQTNGIRNLITKEFLEQTIVEPPLAKQQQIADRISAIRQQAKALQAEGKAILENAKKEVEKMIIG